MSWLVRAIVHYSSQTKGLATEGSKGGFLLSADYNALVEEDVQEARNVYGKRNAKDEVAKGVWKFLPELAIGNR